MKDKTNTKTGKVIYIRKSSRFDGHSNVSQKNTPESRFRDAVMKAVGFYEQAKAEQEAERGVD